MKLTEQEFIDKFGAQAFKNLPADAISTEDNQTWIDMDKVDTKLLTVDPCK